MDVLYNTEPRRRAVYCTLLCYRQTAHKVESTPFFGLLLPPIRPRVMLTAFGKLPASVSCWYWWRGEFVNRKLAKVAKRRATQ